MQDFDVNLEEAEAGSARRAKLEKYRELVRFVLKRVIAFVAFGPGILGCLWLIGRLFKR